MRRLVLCCAVTIACAFSAQAKPSGHSKNPPSGGASAVAQGRDLTSGIFGPDFWEVSGVSAGDALNMRNGPSPRSALLLRLQNRATLRNLGCKINSGARWCRVELPGDPTARGWVNGRYLREGSEPD